MSLFSKMKHILASVTSCIGATAPHLEKYVVCIKVQHKVPATLWYTYKHHADFVRLFHGLVDLTAKTSCAQECSIRCTLASLAALLDPQATDKLANLNKFLHKIVGMVRPSSEHADVCLLRARVDSTLKAFLEWRDDTTGRGGLKRQLSLPSLLLSHNEQQPECVVMNGSTPKFGGSHSYPVKVTKLDTATTSAVLPSASPLAVLRKFRVMESVPAPPTKFPTAASTTCSTQMLHQTNMFNGGAVPSGLPGRRRVFTEVNFDGM